MCGRDALVSLSELSRRIAQANSAWSPGTGRATDPTSSLVTNETAERNETPISASMVGADGAFVAEIALVGLSHELVLDSKFPVFLIPYRLEAK